MIGQYHWQYCSSHSDWVSFSLRKLQPFLQFYSDFLFCLSSFSIVLLYIQTGCIEIGWSPLLWESRLGLWILSHTIKCIPAHLCSVVCQWCFCRHVFWIIKVFWNKQSHHSYIKEETKRNYIDSIKWKPYEITQQNIFSDKIICYICGMNKTPFGKSNRFLAKFLNRNTNSLHFY